MEIINNGDFKNKINVINKLPDDILKEKLKEYYINDEKSMSEISRIYGCSSQTIKRRLEKYGISIRPHGAFLVAEDGETLNSKRNKGDISNIEYRDGQINKGEYKDFNEYNNERVKKMGYESWNDYCNKLRYNKGKCLPMSENKDCSAYLGVYIAERILPLLFDNVKKMPDGNPGFDFICSNGYKIDVKSACLSRHNSRWVFLIKKNKIADYFFMVAFDNRENLNVIHIWLIKGDSVIEKTTWNSEEFIFNEKRAIDITVNNKSLERWIKYERIDLLERSKKICSEFKINNKCNIEDDKE